MIVCALRSPWFSLFGPHAPVSLDCVARLPPLHTAPHVMTEDQIRQALSTVKYPGFTRDIVSFGLLKHVHIEGNDVTVQMALTTADARVPQEIKQDAERVLGAIPGVGKVAVKIDIHAPTGTPGQGGTQAALSQTQIDGVKHVIAVASGKGGCLLYTSDAADE